MGKKNAKVYNNPDIVPYIIGIPLVSLDKYLTMAVNDYGWTIVLYVQADTPTGRKKRVFDVFRGVVHISGWKRFNILFFRRSSG